MEVVFVTLILILVVGCGFSALMRDRLKSAEKIKGLWTKSRRINVGFLYFDRQETPVPFSESSYYIDPVHQITKSAEVFMPIVRFFTGLVPEMAERLTQHAPSDYEVTTHPSNLPDDEAIPSSKTPTSSSSLAENLLMQRSDRHQSSNSFNSLALVMST
jgi:hypothetical protein